MKIIIKNSGNLTNLLRSNLISELDIVGYTDKSPIVFSKSNDDKKIYSTYEALELYNQNFIDAIVFPDGIELDLLTRMINEFDELGIRKEDLLIVKPSKHNEYELVQCQKYTRLRYIELHVADHCNLNCKGCVHFSPLVTKPTFMEYESVKSDLIQLHKKVELIDKIHILGGEPLLNNELYRYVRLVRDVYPYSEISIVTNGLLLGSISEELRETILETDTWITVSTYIPVINKISGIVRDLSLRGIKIRFTDTITTFAVPIDLKGGHANGIQRINCKCPNLYKGKLAVCPIICYIPYFNDYFGLDMDAEDGLIDIYDERVTYEKIVIELHRIRKTCDKCLYVSREDCVERQWAQSDNIRDLKDYVL